MLHRHITICAFRLGALLGTVLFFPSSSPAGALDLKVESGAVWFSRNDVRIPGDGGTEFDMLDLTGKGPDPFVRVYATWNFNRRHALRLTIAPLEIDGTGTLREEVTFKGDVFAADTPTRGTYTFNTYRLTYRWLFYDQDCWRWGLGAAALVRDADISLEQEGRAQSRDDLGLVPLLHLYGEYRLNGRASVVLDVEGAWSPVGRAVDAALMGQYAFDSGWYMTAGYRTLEGGADNDEVYTFAWLHYVQAAVGCRF